MLVRLNSILGTAPETEYELEAGNLRQVLALLKLHQGDKFLKDLVEGKFYYVLSTRDNPENLLLLFSEVLFSDFAPYDTLDIFPEVEGEITAPMVAAAFAATASALGSTATIGTITATIIATVANVALSIGLNMLMSMLSPTPEFSKDPAYSQNKSNLFNGAPILREQGGSMPIVFGNPYCGGVLISSGLFSEEL